MNVIKNGNRKDPVSMYISAINTKQTSYFRNGAKWIRINRLFVSFDGDFSAQESVRGRILPDVLSGKHA